jgi:modification methylase
VTEIASAHVICGDARCMIELGDESVDVVVCSPPYWNIKDYGSEAQIGYGQTLHEYLYDLSRVWSECGRVLKPGRRLCVNIGDQFARSAVYGRYKVIPLHAEVIAQCESLGLDYMGAIIWQKKTTMKTTGGAVVMGSFPYPPNGIVELDYETILLFKRPGDAPKATREQKAASALTKEEWKSYFSGHWTFAGARQVLHEAQFPEELPRRLIRMFSFVGETVLDPFLGSGTTAKVALELQRNVVGYEINPDFSPLIRAKLCVATEALSRPTVNIEERSQTVAAVAPPTEYRPQVQDAKPLIKSEPVCPGSETTYRVTEIVNETTLRLDTGLTVSLCGIAIPPGSETRVQEYLRKYLLGKSVLVKIEGDRRDSDDTLPVYLRLTNRLFVNRKMIEMGLAVADRGCVHKFRDKFIAVEEAQGMRQK